MGNFLIAVVPIRKGSVRVKNKNFKKFAGENLLIHKIRILKKIKYLDDIIINTDSEKAINIAKKLNVNYHKRTKYYASSKCSNSEFWKHIAKVTNSEFIMFTNCTSPMISLKTYIDFIRLFKKNYKKKDSFNTVTEMREFLFYKRKALNFKTEKTPNSQDLPEVLKLNFAINIISKNLMLKKKSLIGDRPFFHKLSEVEGYDINYPFEFDYAEYLFKKFRNK